MPYDDPAYMSEQYRDATNLGARVDLHRRFGTNPYPRQLWVFDRFDPPPGALIPEVGRGPAGLWAENLDRMFAAQRPR